ncbi:MAG: ABC transporter permease [Saprospiraceae bacterium]|nr:ABC transporter permease [Saprospiraceae bacterium]
MLKNYFRLAYRNLLKNRLHSFINISGLTIGMSSFILIALYIQYELSYDQHFEDASQIYRVYTKQIGSDFRGTNEFAVSPMPLAPTLKEEFPEVKQATTLAFSNELVSREGEVFRETGLYGNESSFDIFNFPVVEGIGKAALKDPSAILITQSLANKYFGVESAIGQTLSINQEKLLTVKGILQDPPKNQHFQFDYLTALSNKRYSKYDVGQWGNNNYWTYMKLAEGQDYEALQAKLVAIDQLAAPAYEDVPFKPAFRLQAMTDIHLHSQMNVELQANSDVRYLYLFGAIGFIILFLAAINYMNLATASSAQRAKEVGIRKVMGAHKGQLIRQMLGESFLLTFISFGIALALANAALPLFNQVIDKYIPFSIIGNQWLLIALLGTALLIGGLSGLYPAVFLAVISPVKAFRGNFLKDYRRGTSLRNLLVIGQFVAAIILAIGSVVVYQQLQFIQDKKLGYNREQVVHVSLQQGPSLNKIATLEAALRKHPSIEQVAYAANLPLNSYNSGVIKDWEGNATGEELSIYRNYVGYEFFDLYEMEIVDGRSFSPEHPTDTAEAYVLNEAALQALGWEKAVGKQFLDGQVIGVVKDFHFQPLNFTIQPMYLRYQNYQYNGNGNLNIKLQTEDLKGTLAHIESTVKEFIPNMPYQQFFLDETYSQLYRSEQRIGQAFNIFTLITLFIACMGLFGLVSHQVLQRTKEIGIRKILGASVSQIVELLSKDFVRLVSIALVIAIPVAWLLMQYWLRDFAYRITIPGWAFLVVGLFCITVAFLTISIQSIKAAIANPVEALRHD